MESSYNVKTHVFEGPLDMLLSLVEKRKLFINDISLSQVADDYISYTKNLPNLSYGDIAQFILIASTLVLIKSRSLLPNIILSKEEEDSIDDLENRLKIYQKFKELTKRLKNVFGINISYLRIEEKNKKISFAPDNNLTISKINLIANELILGIPQKELIPKAIVQKVISLEEMMESLTRRINESFKMSFNDFSLSNSGPNSKGRNALAGLSQEQKINVIVSFLALLELVKQGIIEVKQDRQFHDIEIETQSVGTPRYL